MKEVLISLFILAGFVSSAQEPDPGFYDDIAKIKIRQHLKSASFKEAASYSDWDLTYQRMNWYINPEVKNISGYVTSYFSTLVEGMQTIQFDLHNAHSVDSVLSGGTKLHYVHTNNILTIDLVKQYNVQENDSLTVYYHGVPPGGTGFESFVKSSHNNTAIIWTLSEPYGALEWWPCKQSLVDKIDSIDIIVTSPEQYRTASNGILVAEDVLDGKRRTHWKHRYPIVTYLVAISVTNYVNYSDYLDLGDGDSIEILNYVYPEELNSAKQQTPATVGIMELYNNMFGIYPFADEKYGHAQFGWTGGMEHQTMSFMGGFNFELTAHELAHQWFGDYITLGSWHDIWLNEGFATYLSALAYENLSDDKWWALWKNISVDLITSQPNGSVYVSDTTDVRRIFSSRLSYRKGAYLLHMLRWILGDDVFFNAIKNYATDPKIANGFASQKQLVSHLEEAADTSLTEFFDDWYYGEGYPIYSISYAQNESHKLILTLNQVTSHESVNFFEIPVPIRVWNSDSTEFKDFRLNNTFNGQGFEINPEFKISKIEIDPDLWIISKKGQILYEPYLLLPLGLKIFPNPTKNQITYSISHPGKQIDKISLYSLKGELVKIFPGTNQNNTLDLSPFAKGSYVLRFSIEGESVETKVLKQ